MKIIELNKDKTNIVIKEIKLTPFITGFDIFTYIGGIKVNTIKKMSLKEGFKFIKYCEMQGYIKEVREE